MRDLEDQMKELLRERSGDIGLDPRIPAPVVRRSRRRRALTVVAGALAMVAFVVAVGEGISSIATDDRTTAGRPPSAEQGIPGTFVGFTRDDRVVLASSQTGEILSTIAGPAEVGRRVQGADLFTEELALTPDRGGVYFSAFERRGAGRRLMLAPLDGGPPRDLGLGWDPVPSADGTRLAYVACTPDRCGGALVIRDLGTGEEERVPWTDSDLLGLPVAWLPDGRLVVTMVRPGDSAGAVLLIDPLQPPASLEDAATIEPLVKDVTSWRALAYRAPSAGVLIGETCCGPLGESSRIVSVDPDTGDEQGTVVPGLWFVADPDASGRHLLLVDAGGRAFVAGEAGAPRRVAEGFVDVAW